MSKVTVVQVVYNSRRFIEPVFSAIVNQTYKDMRVVAVIAGNDDGGRELIREKFPQVEVIDPGYNIGFAKGHNLVFETDGSEFFQLVNPDLVMEPDYIEKMVRAFDDPSVGAATGKLLSCEFDPFRKTDVLDSTGVVIFKSGSARDRGQHEVDCGQYDNQILVDAVSGAGCMYRRQALEAVKVALASVQRTAYSGEMQRFNAFEYFDEDFHSYWEDVDLSWRMRNAGWKNVFVPAARAYHGRGAGSRKGGYWNVLAYIKHHKAMSPQIRKLNYRNHILMYVKNSKWFYPQFFLREFFMLGYILLFETGTLRIVPEMMHLLPKVWKKRKAVRLREL